MEERGDGRLIYRKGRNGLQGPGRDVGTYLVKPE